MNHSFNTDFADKFGIEEAVFIENIAFWIKKNSANGRHFHDGMYWTYNSYSSWLTLFPYMKTKSKIKRIIDSLVDKKVIILGNYNKIKYDHTSWYAIIDESVLKHYGIDNNAERSQWEDAENAEDNPIESETSPFRNRNDNAPKSERQRAEIGTTIPVINSYEPDVNNTHVENKKQPLPDLHEKNQRCNIDRLKVIEKWNDSGLWNAGGCLNGIGAQNLCNLSDIGLTTADILAAIDNYVDYKKTYTKSNFKLNSFLAEENISGYLQKNYKKRESELET